MEWINPLSDSRWPELTARHSRASVFHTRGWLEALRRTYGYEPTALATRGAGGLLESALVFCRVASPWTGRRLVSLPFSDHCDPLIEDEDQERQLIEAVAQEQRRACWRYIEWRSLRAPSGHIPGSAMSARYYHHRLDLARRPDELLRAFHPNHIVRKIRRSARENLVYAEGRSPALLDAFYALTVLTRRRHGLPPQPYRWFRNLLDCLPEQARVRVAFKEGRAVASIFTLRERDTVVFKFGASDDRYHALGGMQLLLWKTIQEAQANGCVCLDFGRSDLDNGGLIAFKDHWGAARSALNYWRHPTPHPILGMVAESTAALAQRLVPFVPDWLLVRAGTMLYPHVG